MLVSVNSERESVEFESLHPLYCSTGLVGVGVCVRGILNPPTCSFINPVFVSCDYFYSAVSSRL